MSFFDDASLVTIPSGVKDGVLYSVKPIDGSGDLTFSRGSDIEATRVNSQGYIEKAKVNLLTYSNAFNSWSLNTSVSETSGQTGYDGSSDAWKIDLTAAGGRVQEANSQSGVQTYSVYAKAGTLDFILLFCSSGTNINAYFDLSSGTYAGSTTGSIIDAKIESVGGGWYRCSLTHSEAITSVRIYPATAYNDLTATSGNIYIQDAQLNYGLVAQEYQETTTTSVVSGITNDLPRLDYSGGASCPSLLLEPQRTNVTLSSEYVSSAYYVVSNWTGTITPNTTETLSPEGVYNATKFVKSGSTDRVYAHNTQPDGAYTGSVWLKAASGSEDTTIEISVRRFGGGGGSTTKLVTITSEWQRFDVTATNLTGGTTTAMYIADFSSAGTATEFYSYGMQIEAGSYPTSYIPTYGTSATRTADACSKTGISSLIGQTEGTLFLETDTKYFESSNMNFAISDGSNTNNVKFIYELATSKWKAEVNNNGSPMAVIETGVIARGTRVKLAMAYANNDFVFYMNGSLIGTDPSGSTTFPVTLSKISMDRGDGIAPLKGNLYQALVFKTRLSNSDLAALTA